MSVDTQLITTQPRDGQTQVTATAVSDTPAKAAAGVTDLVSTGGIIGTLQTDLAGNSNATFAFLGSVLFVVLAVFVYLVIAAVSANSGVAQHYLAQIFTANAVWVVVAGVLVGGAFYAKSPAQNPPSVPGLSYKDPLQPK